ncbi:hypothetical protein LNQ81_06405 [Myroides sp. M-43]|uniref:hypothetical protein n=1 Tax=Myroides oncorhynchi TaxID=2893756 RepID=UPI001E51B553|nr:hypothetical protein [Myroides oncorhynchi]MCC9042323.1 hypothetical protein [Myroides oncorhynchi]
MKLREMFCIEDKDRDLSLDAVRRIFSLPIVQSLYYNKWLILRDEQLVSDFIEAYSINDDDEFKRGEWAIYFQEDEFNTRLVISRDYINEEGEKDAEMYHYFIRRLGLEVSDVLIFYQAHNTYSDKLSLLTPKDEQSIETAKQWFGYTCDLLLSVNHFFEFDDKISAMVEQAQFFHPDIINQEPPIDIIFYNGILCRVVSIRKGLEILKGLKGVNDKDNELFTLDNLVYDLGEESSFFLVIDNDVEIDELEVLGLIEDYDIDIQGYIFMGNLKVSDSLFCQELDFSPMLVVLGDLIVKNAYFCGNVHYIGGNVYGEVVYAKYNHGELHVKGTLDVRCIVAADMPCYINKIQITSIISDNSVYGLDQVTGEDGLPFFMMNVYPSTHRTRDVFIEEIAEELIWGENFPNDDDIIEAMREGKTLIKESVFTVYADFDMTVAERFNRLFIELIDSNGLASQRIDADYVSEYFFNVYMYEGQKYRELGRKDKPGNYQSRILHNIDTGEYTALVDFFKADGKSLYSAFRSKLTDTFTSTHSAMYAFNQAENEFLKKLGKRK